MNAIALVVVSLGAFLAAYFTYARFLQVRIFNLLPDETVPSRRFQDGIDFVPTRPAILFSHHFVSIAGLGPILGPAIGVIWGWLPAMLWVVFGTIFFGAVHDFGALVISMRSEGRPIGEIVRDTVGYRAGTLFMLIICFLLALAMGVFAYLVAVLFTFFYPESVLPVACLMPIAVLTGYLIYRRRVPVTPATLLGLILMFGAIKVGLDYPVPLYRCFLDPEVGAAVSALPAAALPGPAAAALRDAGNAAGAQQVLAAADRARDCWIWILLGYAFLASVLPVWVLLQPRDYLNSFQLYVGMLLLVGGLIVVNPGLAAPALAPTSPGTPPLFPFLFIVIACGAISGFHSLVSSGTTVRQLDSSAHARAIGYGPMLLESLLAVMAIIVCTARSPIFPGTEDWLARYCDYAQMNRLGTKLDVFISGAGSLIAAVGVPARFARSFMSVVVVAFALTTLDSGTRLMRYDLEALARTFKLRPLTYRFPAGILAVLVIGYFALIKVDGQPAGMALWELFGSANQLLAALGLLAVCVFLYVRRRNLLPFLVPMVFMMVFSLAAMTVKLRDFFREGSLVMLITGIVLLVLTVWLLVETVILIRLFRFGRRDGKG